MAKLQLRTRATRSSYSKFVFSFDKDFKPINKPVASLVLLAKKLNMPVNTVGKKIRNREAINGIFYSYSEIFTPKPPEAF